MSPTVAPTLLERPGPEDGATGRIELGRGTPAIPVPRPSATALMRAAAAADAEAAAAAATSDEAVPDAPPAARRRRARFGRRSASLPASAALRRLPHPPGRRAPIWSAALIAGAMIAAVPGLADTPAQLTASGSDYGLGGADMSVDGGVIDIDARRTISEAEAQQRLGELAASRAAREPETVLPLAGYRLTTRFGMRWGQMHPGWDMAASLGTPIYSATDGVVIRAGRASGFGYAVYIQDAEGNVHIYGHMRYYDVDAGQTVRAGDQIAKVGNEGFSTGPHVHWQIQRGSVDGRAIDPQQWLAERGVRV